MFGDLGKGAARTYRLHTQGSIYLLGIHEERGRKHVILRGEPGSDREHVVVRDSDPRLGDVSLFELENEPERWLGQKLEVAGMITSEISEVEVESNPLRFLRLAAQQNPRLVVVPAGLQEHPRVGPVPSRGTLPSAAVPAVPPIPAGGGYQPPKGGYQPSASGAGWFPAASQSTSEAAAPAPDYPLRHVGYAEQAAAMLRSIANREKIFSDLVEDPAVRTRLRKALDECDELLKKIRKRDRR